MILAVKFVIKLFKQVTAKLSISRKKLLVYNLVNAVTSVFKREKFFFLNRNNITTCVLKLMRTSKLTIFQTLVTSFLNINDFLKIIFNTSKPMLQNLQSSVYEV